MGAPFNIIVNNAPAAPVLSTPTNGATTVSSPATLDVAVSDPDSDHMTATFYGRLKPVIAQYFKVELLPDTQFYSQSTTYWPTFTAQTNWIVANQAPPLSIAFVSGLGDVQQDLDTNEAEWQRASSSLAVLDNSTIPHGMSPGNHDQNSAGVAAFYDQYFPVSRFQGFPWYGGYLGRMPTIPSTARTRTT